MRIRLYHILSLCCIITFLLYPHLPEDNALNYNFLHVNIFHLTANLIGLYMFRPRAFTIIVSFAIAVVAYLIDDAMFSCHTYGLSAMLLAMYARPYISWKREPLTTIYAIIIFGMMPRISWHIHLIAFVLGLLVWYIYYKFKRCTST